MLSLLLPLGAGVVTRLALRPRGQSQQQQPLTINAPWWALVGGWVLVVLLTLLGLVEPTKGSFSHALALIIGAGVVGLLLPEIFRGLGQATTSGLSKPKNWLWLGVIVVVLYGLLVDSEIFGGLFLLGVLWLGYRVILGMVKPPKKGG
jgi:uncharacterized membrane protein YdcZ (DUF606 family)